jgi:hypothetical protein
MRCSAMPHHTPYCRSVAVDICRLGFKVSEIKSQLGKAQSEMQFQYGGLVLVALLGMLTGSAGGI